MLFIIFLNQDLFILWSQRLIMSFKPNQSQQQFTATRNYYYNNINIFEMKSNKLLMMEKISRSEKEACEFLILFGKY